MLAAARAEETPLQTLHADQRKSMKIEKCKCLTCCISPVEKPSSATPGCVSCRLPSFSRNRWTLTTRFYWSGLTGQNSYLLSRPSIYSFFFFLLSWADCLFRIFLRIFFRIRSSLWLRDRLFSVICGMAFIGDFTGEMLPLWGVADWAELPPLLPTASSHLRWGLAPVRIVGRSVAPAKETHSVNTIVELVIQKSMGAFMMGDAALFGPLFMLLEYCWNVTSKEHLT